MRYTDQRAAQPAVAPWEQGFCSTTWCREHSWYVQRSTEHPELWRIVLRPGEGEWLVAAPGPLCPLCGGTLLTLTPFEEGREARN
jgi:hypothetical protein